MASGIMIQVFHVFSLSLLQADSMSSNKDMAQKYKSAAAYEDDFM